MKTYSNKYGTLVVEPITEVMPVKEVRLANFPDDAKFDLDTAERVVLITENRRSQIVVASVHQPVGLVVHESPSTCWIARIVSLDYTGPNPQQAIEDERRRTPSILV